VVWLSGYGFDLFTDIPKLYGAVSPEVAAKIPVGADWQEREAIAVGRPAEPLPWDADRRAVRPPRGTQRLREACRASQTPCDSHRRYARITGVLGFRGFMALATGVDQARGALRRLSVTQLRICRDGVDAVGEIEVYGWQDTI